MLQDGVEKVRSDFRTSTSRSNERIVDSNYDIQLWILLPGPTLAFPAVRHRDPHDRGARSCLSSRAQRAPRSAGALQAAADQLGCDIAAVEAVLDVETGGFGFDYAGRPKMLFEPHIFWQNLSGASSATRVAHARLALTVLAWKPDSSASDGSYPRFCITQL